MGTGCPYPGLNRGRGVTLTTHSHLVPASRKSRSYISSLSWHLHGGSGTTLLYLMLCKFQLSVEWQGCPGMWKSYLDQLHFHKNKGISCDLPQHIFRSSGAKFCGGDGTSACRQKNVTGWTAVAYSDKCPYEIQEQKEVPVRYTDLKPAQFEHWFMWCILSLRWTTCNTVCPKSHSAALGCCVVLPWCILEAQNTPIKAT
jgi:hypothetical protein